MGISHIISAYGRIEARCMVYASVKTTDSDVKIKRQRYGTAQFGREREHEKKGRWMIDI